MTYSEDKNKSILDKFDEYFESVASNVNNDSSEQEIEEMNEAVQEFLDELNEQINNS